MSSNDAPIRPEDSGDVRLPLPPQAADKISPKPTEGPDVFVELVGLEDDRAVPMNKASLRSALKLGMYAGIFNQASCIELPWTACDPLSNPWIQDLLLEIESLGFKEVVLNTGLPSGFVFDEQRLREMINLFGPWKGFRIVAMDIGRLTKDQRIKFDNRIKWLSGRLGDRLEVVSGAATHPISQCSIDEVFIRYTGKLALCCHHGSGVSFADRVDDGAAAKAEFIRMLASGGAFGPGCRKCTCLPDLKEKLSTMKKGPSASEAEHSA